MPKQSVALLKYGINVNEIAGPVPQDLKLVLMGTTGLATPQITTISNLFAGGVSLPHSGLTGLGGDDHPLYLTNARADAWLGNKTSDAVAEGATNLYMTPAQKTEALAGPNDRPENSNPPVDARVEIQRPDGTLESTKIEDLPGAGGGGITDHGQLTGLSADHHNAGPNAYHTDARAATWLSAQGLAATNITAAEIKVSYESNVDTNAFTDTEKSKLAGIETGATGDQTGAEIKALYEAEPDTNVFDDAAQSKLAGITWTPAGVATLYESNANTNKYTDAEKNRLAAIPFDDSGQVNGTVTVLDPHAFLFLDDGGEPTGLIGGSADYNGLAIWTDDPTGTSPVDDPGPVDIHGAGIFLSSTNTAYFNAQGAFSGARLELGGAVSLIDGRTVYPLTFVQPPPASNVQTDSNPGPVGPLRRGGVGEILDAGVSITSNYNYGQGSRFEYSATVINNGTRTGSIYVRNVISGVPGSWYQYTVLSAGSQPWDLSGLLASPPTVGDVITLEFYAESGNNPQFSCDVTDITLLIEQPGEGDAPVSHSGLTNLDADDHNTGPNAYHTDARADTWFGTQTLGNLSSLDAAAKNITNVGTVGGANMANVPTAAEKSALPGAGTGNAPAGANPYVTDSDTRLGHQDTRDPLNTDDDTATPPFALGSRWINTLTDDEWVCTVATTGAAKWVKTTEVSGTTDHSALSNLGADDHTQYHTDARGDARYAPIAHPSDTNNPHAVTKAQVGLGDVENTKVNSSSSNPSGNDDSSAGYSIGSRWVNTNTNREFVCTDASVGSASWVETTNSDHSNLQNLGADSHQQYILAAHLFPGLKRDGFLVGDGVTDDSAAFDAVMAQAVAAGGIRVEPGVYRIGNASTVALPAGFRFIGEGGPEQCVLDYQGNRNTAPVDADNTLFLIHGNNIHVEGVQFRRVPVAFMAGDGTGEVAIDTYAISGDITKAPTFENCIFDRCVHALWQRSQNVTDNWRFDKLTVRNSDVIDCPRGFNTFCLNQHDHLIENNRFRGTSQRAIVSGEAINVLGIDSSNADAARAVLAQITNRSGGHIITGNHFENYTLTTTTSQDFELQHLRITLQNNTVISNNYFGPIAAANVSATDFDAELVYTKLIGGVITENVFQGPVSGNTATQAVMLNLKADGYYHPVSTNETRGWGVEVSQNVFRGSGDRGNVDTLSSAIGVFQDLATVSNNFFQDIHVRNFSGVIRHYGSMTGTKHLNNTFVKCSGQEAGYFGHITIDEGGDGYICDGLFVTDPCPAANEAGCNGFYFNEVNSAENIRDWQIRNVYMKGLPSGPRNRIVDLYDSGSTITADGLEISDCGSDGANFNRGVSIVNIATVSPIAIKNCNFTGIAIPINNPQQVAIVLDDSNRGLDDKNEITPEMFGAIRSDDTATAANSAAFRAMWDSWSNDYPVGKKPEVVIRGEYYFADGTGLSPSNGGANEMEGIQIHFVNAYLRKKGQSADSFTQCLAWDGTAMSTHTFTSSDPFDGHPIRPIVASSDTWDNPQTGDPFVDWHCFFDMANMARAKVYGSVIFRQGTRETTLSCFGVSRWTGTDPGSPRMDLSGLKYTCWNFALDFYCQPQGQASGTNPAYLAFSSLGSYETRSGGCSIVTANNTADASHWSAFDMRGQAPNLIHRTTVSASRMAFKCLDPGAVTGQDLVQVSGKGAIVAQATYQNKSNEAVPDKWNSIIRISENGTVKFDQFRPDDIDAGDLNRSYIHFGAGVNGRQANTGGRFQAHLSPIYTEGATGEPPNGYITFEGTNPDADNVADITANWFEGATNTVFSSLGSITTYDRVEFSQARENRTFLLRNGEFVAVKDGLNGDYDVTVQGLCVCDGVTDDTDALNAAAAQARSQGKRLYIPRDTVVSSGNVDLTGLRIECNANISVTHGYTISIGGNSDVRSSKIINFNGVVGPNQFAPATAPTVPFLRLWGKQWIVNIAACQYFQLYANGDNSDTDSTAWNYIYATSLEWIELFAEGSSGTPWINDNHFFGARCVSIKFTNAGGASYRHNNNTFTNIALEHQSTVPRNFEVIIASGHGNHIKGRLEGDGTINFDSLSSMNVVEKMYHQSRDPMSILEYPQGYVKGGTITDAGFGNILKYAQEDGYVKETLTVTEPLDNTPSYTWVEGSDTELLETTVRKGDVVGLILPPNGGWRIYTKILDGNDADMLTSQAAGDLVIATNGWRSWSASAAGITNTFYTGANRAHQSCCMRVLSPDARKLQYAIRTGNGGPFTSTHGTWVRILRQRSPEW